MIDQPYGHLAPDADERELGRLDAFDSRGWAHPGHRRLTIALTRPSEKPRTSGAFSRCARHDSNVRPLPPQGSALSPELRALEEGQCSGVAAREPTASSASSGTSR